MLTAIYSVLLGCLPWGLGVAILYALLYQPKQWAPGHHLIVIGLGSYIGYMILAIVLYQLQARNLPVFSNWIIAWALTGLLACWVFGQLGRHFFRTAPKNSIYSDFDTKEPKWLILALCTLLLIQFGFVVHEVALRPAVSWDTLLYWSRVVPHFLDWQASDPSQGSINFNQRHPSTIHLLNVWSSYSGQFNRNALFLYAPWLAIYSGILIAGIGFTWTKTRRLVFGLMVGILIASSSILAAHVSLGGYADIWLAAGLFFSAAMLPLATTSWKPLILVVWIFVTTTLTFIKAAGISYTTLLLALALLAWTMSRCRLSLATIAILTAMIVSVLLYSGVFDLSISGYRITFEPKTHQIILGHYKGVAQLLRADIALQNIGVSLLLQASYVGAALVLLLTWVSAMRNYGYWRQFSPLYVLLLGSSLFFYGWIAQLFSDHFFLFSSPKQDTGLTRFSQGWFLVCTLLVCQLIQSQSKQNHL